MVGSGLDTPPYVKELRERLELLADTQAGNFDGATLRYVSVWLDKLAAIPPARGRAVVEKLKRVLLDYQQRIHEARVTADTYLMELEAAGLLDPDLKHLVDVGDFLGFNRKAKICLALNSRGRGCEVYRSGTIVDLLHPDDQAQLRLLEELEGDEDIESEISNNRKERVNLDAMQPSLRYLREAAGEFEAVRAIGEASRKVPEVAGPLNAQTLVTKLLQMADNISPVYMKRIVGYWEIQRQLEQLPEQRPKLSS
ncbi:MAG: DUF2894 domain-containing protein [Myxococcota bacterium]|nr:DUF2894 domain-containing protein [Myxococcota bacterium]